MPFVLLAFFTGRAEPAHKPITLAFYHPWYATPWGPTHRWYKWDSFRFHDRYSPDRIKADGHRDIAAVEYPLIGPYDQTDPEVVRWHFRLAKAAGIDGFLCSWWKGSSEWHHWQADLFEKVLLPIAQQENFKIGVIDECAHYIPSYDRLVSRAVDNLPRLASHPAYLKINGQPVWFVYQVWDDWLTAPQAEKYIDTVENKVGDVFWMFDKMSVVATAGWPHAKMEVKNDWLGIPKIDCFGTYSYAGHWRDMNPRVISALYSGFAEQVHHAGKKVQLPVLPGHNNTPVEPEPFIISRKNGKTLKTFLHATEKAKADVVVICSFNEWLEGTEIEPNLTKGDPYVSLKVLAKWHDKKWVTPPLPPTESFDPLLRARMPR